MSQTIKPKGMTLGEGGLALFFAALAFASIMAAGKADDASFAFHAFLAGAAARLRSSPSSIGITRGP